MATNLGYSSRAIFGENKVIIKKTLEVENLEAKHSTIEFSEGTEQDIEITHDDDVQHIFTEDGDFVINNGSLHCRSIIMEDDTPWSQESPYEYYIYGENNTLLNGTNPQNHLVFPTQTFKSVGNTNSIFTEFKLTSVPTGFTIDFLCVHVDLRQSTDSFPVLNQNKGFTILPGTSSTLAQDDIIKLELQPNNKIVVYQNGVVLSHLLYSQNFSIVNNHHEGSETKYTWALRPYYPNGLNTFRMKMLDSWIDGELHNESQIDIGTLLNINKSSTNLVNLDEKSFDFEIPFHSKSVASVTDLIALNSSLTSSAVVWCNSIKCLVMWNGSGWEVLNGAQKTIIVKKTTTLVLTTQLQELTELNTSFEALSQRYLININIFLNDASTGSLSAFYGNIRNKSNNTQFLTSDRLFAKFDENDDLVVSVSFLIKQLTIGTTYDIVPVFKKNSNDALGIYTGGIYPDAVMTIKPVNGNTTVVS